MTTNRPLRVFLCHSSADKLAVRELYQKLRAEPWIEPWLDEEELFPGMDWNLEIEKAIEATDVILVCLSNNSITKEGYVQREIRIALDYADYKPDGTLFIIPVRLEKCAPPKRLARWQYADYFEGQRERGFERLLISLRKRAESLGIYSEKIRSQKEKEEIIDRLEELISKNQKIARPNNLDYEVVRNKLVLSNGMEFMRIPAGKFLMGSKENSYYCIHSELPQHLVDIPNDYWMARCLVTNELYNNYVIAKSIKHPVADWKKKKDHPVTVFSWDNAMEYCRWLNNLLEAELHSDLVLRLPTEAEWEKAARGTNGRKYPWGNKFYANRCNTKESGEGGTTPVGFYSPQGDSPFGCADMVGNVFEWTHSLVKPYPYKINDGREDEQVSGPRMLRGGSFSDFKEISYSARRASIYDGIFGGIGIRVVIAPTITKGS